MKKLITGFVVLGLAACMQNPDSHSAKAASDAFAASNQAAVTAESVPKWTYFVENDEMRREVILFSSVRSMPEEVGGQVITLNFGFFKKPNTEYPVGNMSLSNEKFDCDAYSGCTVHYRIDDGEVSSVSAMYSSDSLSGLLLGCTQENIEKRGVDGACTLDNLFLYNKLQNAKQVIFEVPVLGSGAKQFKFDVSDYRPYEEWEKLSANFK